MDGYTIERISEARLKDLHPLYKDAFKKSVPHSYFEKKFDTAAFGAEYIGYLAYDEQGHPAAYYGLFPCKMVFRGKLVLSATSGDTMTHSAHRGKGLFVNLAKRTYALAKESGIKFAYGFPNQHSLPGSIKLGWQYKGEFLKYYHLKVRTLPVSRLARKLRMTEGLYGAGTNAHFDNSLEEEGFGTVLHDKKYFQYKNYSKKSIISIEGAKVWIKVDGVLLVGDVEKRRKHDLDVKAFLDTLKKYATWKGIQEIRFMVSRNSWLDKKLAERLVGKNAFPVGHFDFDAKGLDFSKFRYGMGDLDTF
jgi:hypothetical protein